MAAGVVHLPLYATGFRGDDLQAALEYIAPISTKYGATRYEVFRNRDDRYRFLLAVDFDDHAGWEAYWYGPEFTEFRTACSGWFQVPLLYVWNDLVTRGEVREPEPTPAPAPAGVTAGEAG
jgi:quinol monooxygenase YgiN